MSTLVSNNFLYLLATKQINMSSDTFKMILMDSSFVFNRATHDELADVAANELPTANGYTIGGQVLAGVSVTRDNILNICKTSWSNVSWAASGTLSSNGAIIFDDTVAGDPIVGYIDFGGTQVTYSGGTATIANPTIVNAG